MTVTTHTYTATLHTGTAAGALPLDVREGSVTTDEGWSPRVQGSIAVAPATPFLLENTDPRYHRRRLVLTCSDGATSDTYNLLVRSRAVDPATGFLVLELASDEVLLLSDMHLGYSPRVEGQAFARSVRALVNWVLSLHGATLSGMSPDHDFTVGGDLDALIWQPGTTAWEYLEPLVRTAGLRLWCDGERVWRLSPSWFMVDAMHTFELGRNIVGLTEMIDLDGGDWFDAVQLHYRWTDAQGVSREAYDFASFPASVKPRLIEINRPFPGLGAANYILFRMANRGREVQVTSVSRYDIVPAQIIGIISPGQPPLSGVVVSVRYDLGTDEMTVVSRDLTDTSLAAWVYAPTGYRWADIPAGTSWATYQPAST